MIKLVMIIQKVQKLKSKNKLVKTLLALIKAYVKQFKSILTLVPLQWEFLATPLQIIN